MSIHFDAAIYIQSLPCNVVSIRRAQKRDSSSNIGGRACPLERNALHRLLEPLALIHPETSSLSLINVLPHRRHRDTWTYGIHVDIVWSQISRSALCDADHGPLCRGVMCGVGSSTASGNRREIHDFAVTLFGPSGLLNHIGHLSNHLFGNSG